MTSSPFVTQLSPLLAKKLQEDLSHQGFTFSTPPHTTFSAKKPGLSCTLYQSGKLVIQGKNAAEFIEFYIEPELLEDFSHTQASAAPLDLTPHIGVDEAGKGDFFGPLCIAGVYADGAGIKKMREMGVKDSKNMKDSTILKLAKEIKASFPHCVIQIGPKRYNEMYAQFANLNTLLAWGHATAIENLAKETHCQEALIDKFAAEHVVERALKKKNLAIQLTQKTKGESDPIVAAASILARAAFVTGIEALGKTYGLELPKGASKKVIEAGRLFCRKVGEHSLPLVAKTHFKTLDSIRQGS